MIVIITSIRPNTGETVTVAEGVREDGSPVTFAGDWRPMRDLARAFADIGEPIEVEIEDWQVIG